MNQLIPFLALITLSNAFAQTKTTVHPTTTRTAAAAPTVTQTTAKESTLDAAKKTALAEKDRLEKLLAEENAKTTGNNFCITNALSWQLRANEWFLSHYNDFEKIEKDYDTRLNTVLSAANQKWAILRGTEVTALAVDGQKTQEVSIHFDTMVEYLKNYNAKFAACVPAQRRDLRKIQNDPHQNKYGLTLDQMIVAAKQMTSNINASLKKTSNQFELSFSETETGFKFEFKVEFANSSGKTETVIFDALGTDTATLSINETNKWKRLLDENPKIGDVETDGAQRLKHFETESKLASCERNLVGKLPISSMGTPFQTLASVQTEIDHEVALGARSKTASGAHSAASDSQSWTQVVAADGKVPLTTTQLMITNQGEISFLVGSSLVTFNASSTWSSKNVLPHNTPGVYDSATGTFAQMSTDNAKVIRLQSLNSSSSYYNAYIHPEPSVLLGFHNNVIYYLSSDQSVYRFTTAPNDNNSMSGSSKLDFAATSSLSFGAGKVLYGILDGNLVKLSADEKQWESVPGADFDTFSSDVIQAEAVSPTEIYVLTRRGDLFQYANRQWQNIATSEGSKRIIHFAANQNGKVCGVSFDGKIWCLNPDRE